MEESVYEIISPNKDAYYRREVTADTLEHRGNFLLLKFKGQVVAIISPSSNVIVTKIN